MSKRRYGDKFGNVVLTNDELKELAEKYKNNYVDYINKLDEYVERTQRQYNSHYDTLIEWMEKDGVFKSENKTDLTPREIFIDYDGKNGDEIKRLRKLWKPKCSKCQTEMEFWKFKYEFEIGVVPKSLHKCPNCMNYYICEVDEYNNGQRMLFWDYNEDPKFWSAEAYDEIMRDIFGDDYIPKKEIA